MTRADIEILLRYLTKATVPQADQDRFIHAVERLQALLGKVSAAA
jgi:hypothetical protein